jgi:hypothetical protein
MTRRLRADLPGFPFWRLPGAAADALLAVTRNPRDRAVTAIYFFFPA